MNFIGSKKFVKYGDLKIALWLVVYLTLVISVFDFKPDLAQWLKEIGRNFFLITSITAAFVITSPFFRYDSVSSKLVRAALTIINCIVVSISGGYAGWKINELLFGFNVTHPLIFFTIIFLVTLFSAFSLGAYASWKESMEILKKKQLNEQRLIQLKTKAELEAIRSKLDPHFMFNSLNSAMSLIRTDPDKAEEMLQKFASILRSILNKNELATLSEELELAGEYLSIEKIRFGQRLDYSITADESVLGTVIPSMFIQPLVENSIKHGIGNLEKGEIRISAQKVQGGVNIKVADNGSGFEAGRLNGGLGLNGLKERLELYYGNKHSFDTSNEIGCCISVTIAETLPGKLN